MAKKSKYKIIYSEYINSDLWRAKRQEFLRLGNHENCCAKCKLPYGPKFHVHHLTYKRFGKENLDDLMLLCEPCHALLHKHKPKSTSLKAWSYKFVGDKKLNKKTPKKKKAISLRDQREAEQLKKLKARAKKLEKTSKSKPIPPGTIVTSTLRKKRKRRR